MTKLTLTISDPSIIEEAKSHAKETGRSLSAIVENLLKTLLNDKKDSLPQKQEEISPIVKSLKGVVSVPENWDDKEELYKALSEKYLKE